MHQTFGCLRSFLLAEVQHWPNFATNNDPQHQFHPNEHVRVSPLPSLQSMNCTPNLPCQQTAESALPAYLSARTFTNQSIRRHLALTFQRLLLFVYSGCRAVSSLVNRTRDFFSCCRQCRYGISPASHLELQPDYTPITATCDSLTRK
jgi:hypothetical protein